MLIFLLMSNKQFHPISDFCTCLLRTSSENLGAVAERATQMSSLATKGDRCFVFVVINEENPASNR